MVASIGNFVKRKIREKSIISNMTLMPILEMQTKWAVLRTQ